MIDLAVLSKTKLEEDEKKAIKELCDGLERSDNIDVKSINLYGSAVRPDFRPGRSDINLLVVADKLDVPVLKNVLDMVFRGRRFGISPFFITEDNLRSSTDVFPIKFLTIRESYILLSGTDILQQIVIGQEHLRLRCEQEVKNLLLRLRRHYIMSGGQGLNEMMSRMIIGFLETLRIVLYLIKNEMPAREEVIDLAEKEFNIEGTVLKKIREMHDSVSNLSRENLEEIYNSFTLIVEKIAKITDQFA